MAYEDLTGGSGFISNSEGAEANLNINMSEDSARNLWDVQAAVQQIAVDFQTVVRSAADFQSYLISIRETSQTIRMPSLGLEGGPGGNMEYSGGRVDASSVPSVTQSETSMASRIGEMEENASGAGGGALAAQGGRPFDPASAINQMTNVAWMATMAGQQGANPVTSEAYQSAYRYAQGRVAIDPQVMAAQYGGQTGTPHAFAASQLLAQGLPAAQQFLRGGGLGMAAGAIGRLGAYGAVAYGAYQLTNAVLDNYAQSRAMGIATNNEGTGWGFRTRVSQAQMALSPFVSQEEASQIYSLAIDQGWASRKGGFAQGDFGQAVNFMYEAAKDYNMTPQMSSQLLQSNALQAGESVQALSEQLATLKKSLDGTGVSMAAAASGYSSFTSSLISGGANPEDAALFAGGVLKSFSGNTFLGPNASGAAYVQALTQSPSAQAIVGAQIGALPGAAFSGDNLDRSKKKLQELVHNLAVSYSAASMPGMSEPNRVAMFTQQYNARFQQNISQAAGRNIMNEALDPNFFLKGEAEFAAAGEITLQHRSYYKPTNYFGEDDTYDTSLEGNKGSIDRYFNYSPQVNDLLARSGKNLKKVTLIGPDGNPVTVDGTRIAGANIAKWFSDEANFQKFKNEGYSIKDQSGRLYTAKDIGMGGSNVQAVGGQSDNNTVFITLSDDAKKLIKTDKDKVEFSSGKSYFGSG